MLKRSLGFVRDRFLTDLADPAEDAGGRTGVVSQCGEGPAAIQDPGQRRGTEALGSRPYAGHGVQTPDAEQTGSIGASDQLSASIGKNHGIGDGQPVGRDHLATQVREWNEIPNPMLGRPLAQDHVESIRANVQSVSSCREVREAQAAARVAPRPPRVDTLYETDQPRPDQSRWLGAPLPPEVDSQLVRHGRNVPCPSGFPIGPAASGDRESRVVGALSIRPDPRAVGHGFLSIRNLQPPVYVQARRDPQADGGRHNDPGNSEQRLLQVESGSGDDDLGRAHEQAPPLARSPLQYNVCIPVVALINGPAGRARGRPVTRDESLHGHYRAPPGMIQDAVTSFSRPGNMSSRRVVLAVVMTSQGLVISIGQPQEFLCPTTAQAHFLKRARRPEQ